MSITAILVAVALQTSAQSAPQQAQPARWEVADADCIARDVRFGSGETLPQVRLHYATLGAPHRDASGEIDNAVMLLHGAGGSGRQLLQPQFAISCSAPVSRSMRGRRTGRGWDSSLLISA